jgi:hypothetical protein
MRVPDYGNGNWEIKAERNKKQPYITKIGVNKDTIFIGLSHIADSIKVYGQGHSTLLLAKDSDYAQYVMKEKDPYARFTVYFPTGEVIFSNPFARYDASKETSPFKDDQFSVNILLTVLFNATLLALLALLVFTFYKTIIKR